LGNKIEDGYKGKTCMGKKRNAYRVSVGINEGKRLTGRPKF